MNDWGLLESDTYGTVALTREQLHGLLTAFFNQPRMDLGEEIHLNYKYGIYFYIGWFIRWEGLPKSEEGWDFRFGYQEYEKWDPDRRFPVPFSLDPQSNEPAVFKGKWTVSARRTDIYSLWASDAQLRRHFAPFRLALPDIFEDGLMSVSSFSVIYFITLTVYFLFFSSNDLIYT